PRLGVVGTGDAAAIRDRLRCTGAATRQRNRQRAGTSSAARLQRRKALQARVADAERLPIAAHRAGARRCARDRAQRRGDRCARHRLNILAVMPTQPTGPAPIADFHEPAAARWRTRMARAPQSPWLHAEVARRMAERLPIIRQAPQRWLDWW